VVGINADCGELIYRLSVVIPFAFNAACKRLFFSSSAVQGKEKQSSLMK
jgi:hypothetical protein